MAQTYTLPVALGAAVVLGLVLGLAIGWLLRPGTSAVPPLAPNSLWDAHATLNALNKICISAERGDIINVELAYTLGDHLRLAAALQRQHGIIASDQVESWVEALLNLHSRMRGEMASTAIRIRVPAGLKSMQLAPLAAELIKLCHTELQLRRMEIVFLRPNASFKGAASKRLYTAANVKVEFVAGVLPAATDAQTAGWKWEPGVASTVVELPCEYRRIEGPGPQAPAEA